jgi:hypothetical protein
VAAPEAQGEQRDAERKVCVLFTSLYVLYDKSPLPPEPKVVRSGHAVSWTCDHSYFAALSQLLCDVAEPHLEFEDDALSQ